MRRPTLGQGSDGEVLLRRVCSCQVQSFSADIARDQTSTGSRSADPVRKAGAPAVDSRTAPCGAALDECDRSRAVHRPRVQWACQEAVDRARLRPDHRRSPNPARRHPRVRRLVTTPLKMPSDAAIRSCEKPPSNLRRKTPWTMRMFIRCAGISPAKAGEHSLLS